MQSGYDISVAADSQVGFESDYNDLYTTATGSLGLWQGETFTSLVEWYYELGLDQHSIAVDPQFVNPSGPEGSFDFHLLPSSPAIAAGNPDSYYFEETVPDGDRIDLGAYGDTSQATASPTQVVQVLSPVAVDKVQVGQQVSVTWQTAGLTTLAPVALVDAGGSGFDNFGPDLFQTSVGSTDQSFTSAVDTSGVADPAPQAVYQSYAQAAYGVGNALSYNLPVPDGVYTIRLDFVEPDSSETVGGRVFDIDLQGQTVQQGYDIVAAAGGALTATEETDTVTASGGDGINLSLINDTSTPAVLSGIEVFAANAAGVANPTVDLSVSANGGTSWTTVATGLTMDRFGRGSYIWTVPSDATPGNQYELEVTADQGTQPQGISAPFLVANAGNDFYINDGSTAGDVFTTAPGNDANSGKSPDSPMASLQALLSAYTFEPGDVIYVDTGTYDLPNNIVLGPQDSGITIEGPSTAVALFDRGNTEYGTSVIEMGGATGVTLEDLELTGAYYGLDAPSGAGSTGLTVSNSVLFDNQYAGAFIDSGNAGASFMSDTAYGEPYGFVINAASAVLEGNTADDDSGSGMSIGAPAPRSAAIPCMAIRPALQRPAPVRRSAATRCSTTSMLASTPAARSVVSGNTVYGQTGSGAGIELSSGAQATGNTVYGNGTGITSDDGGLVSDNLVYGNAGTGIAAGDYYGGGLTTIQGNQVHTNQVGVDLTPGFYGTVANNVLEGNTTAGILDEAGTSYGVQALVNNTIDAETGNAVQVDGSTIDARLQNNILWAQSGYDISVAADSQVGFESDYNDLYTTATGSLGLWQGETFTSLVEWYYELGLDQHSIAVDPQFVNPSGPEGSFDFHLLPSSPAIAAGNPDSYYFEETVPDGDRIDLGAYGDTSQATASPTQVVQVLSPVAVDKVQVGQQVSVTWQTAGLTTLAPVAPSMPAAPASTTSVPTCSRPRSARPTSRSRARSTPAASPILRLRPSIRATRRPRMEWVTPCRITCPYPTGFTRSASTSSSPIHPRRSAAVYLTSTSRVRRCSRATTSWPPPAGR